jgi:hypothetical protein
MNTNKECSERLRRMMKDCCLPCTCCWPQRTVLLAEEGDARLPDCDTTSSQNNCTASEAAAEPSEAAAAEPPEAAAEPSEAAGTETAEAAAAEDLAEVLRTLLA